MVSSGLLRRVALVYDILEDGIIHSHRRENLKSYIALTGWALLRKPNVSPVKYDLVLYFPRRNYS
jgi:hypothetical protein